MERVGKVSKSAALKALLTWVDHGVLKEDSENTFVLLEVAEVAVQRERTRLAVAEQEASTTPEQQQQSQQLMVYWKVRRSCALCWMSSLISASVYPRNADEFTQHDGRTYTLDAEFR